MVTIARPLEIEEMLRELKALEDKKTRKIKNLLYKTRPNYLLDEDAPNQPVYERRVYLKR